MKDERYKEIMESLGMPNSQSLKLALEQVVNVTHVHDIITRKTWNHI